MTAPLIDAGALPGRGVARVRVVAAWGRACVIQRLALSGEDGAPLGTVVAKGPATAAGLRAFKEELGLPAIEAAVYGLPGAELLGRPALVAAVPAGRSRVLVMEDVAGRRMAGADDLTAMLRRLGRFHARWWGRVPPAWEWLPAENAPGRAAYLTSALAGDGRTAALREPWLTGLLGARLGAYLGMLPAVLHHLSRPPHTLVHGDLHTGNVLVDADGGYRVLDWEAAARSRGAVDLVFLLLTAAPHRSGPVDVAAACDTYLMAVRAGGVWPAADFALDVRVAVLYYFLRRLAMRATFAGVPGDAPFRAAAGLLADDTVWRTLRGWAAG